VHEAAFFSPVIARVGSGGRDESWGTDDLSMVPLGTAYRFAWTTFFPGAKLIK